MAVSNGRHRCVRGSPSPLSLAGRAWRAIQLSKSVGHSDHPGSARSAFRGPKARESRIPSHMRSHSRPTVSRPPLCLLLRSAPTPMTMSHVVYRSLPFREALSPLVQISAGTEIDVQPHHRALTSCRRGTYSTGSAVCISHRSTSSDKNRQHLRPPILKPRRRPARASLRIVPSLHRALAAAPCTSSHGVLESRSGI